MEEDYLILLIDTGRKDIQGQPEHTSLNPKGILQSPESLSKEVEATERQCFLYRRVVNPFMTKDFF